ncbi:MAG TPA: SCP2 sterol-binding domain-containing protein [Acidimicrobiia bacterium]
MTVDTVAYVVAKGKKELSRRVVRVDDGRVCDADTTEAADVTFTMTPEVAAEFDAGALDVNVGFMRGTIKMAGDNAALLRVLPALRSTPAR